MMSQSAHPEDLIDQDILIENLITVRDHTNTDQKPVAGTRIVDPEVKSLRNQKYSEYRRLQSSHQHLQASPLPEH